MTRITDEERRQIENRSRQREARLRRKYPEVHGKVVDFILAGVPGGHAHRFRDAFSVELLLAGVPIERDSILLGHQSVRITEKHYAPWVRARQDQLEADVRRTWESAEPQRRVHAEKGARNLSGLRHR
jgi:integrase